MKLSCLFISCLAGLVTVGCGEPCYDCGDGPPDLPLDVPDASSDELEVVETVSAAPSAEALAHCAQLEPVGGPEIMTVHLLGLEDDPEYADPAFADSDNRYLATYTAVDGVADLTIPMAICPEWLGGSHHVRVQCQLIRWDEDGELGGFDDTVLMFVDDYGPCAFSSITPGEYFLSVETWCAPRTDTMLGGCTGHGKAFANITVE